MSAAEHIHPEQLKNLAEEFSRKELGFDPMDPEEAEDQCVGCSRDFLEWGKSRGISGAVRYYATPTGYHAVARVDTSAGPHIVDHSYNQYALYDDDLAVRLAEPSPWLEDMPMVKTLDKYDSLYMRYPKSGTEDPEQIKKITG